jgi:hypothetical protein
VELFSCGSVPHSTRDANDRINQAQERLLPGTSRAPWREMIARLTSYNGGTKTTPRLLCIVPRAKQTDRACQAVLCWRCRAVARQAATRRALTKRSMRAWQARYADTCRMLKRRP